eukprot:5820261-Amphidinium_carterae.1
MQSLDRARRAKRFPVWNPTDLGELRKLLKRRVLQKCVGLDQAVKHKLLAHTSSHKDAHYAGKPLAAVLACFS